MSEHAPPADQAGLYLSLHTCFDTYLAQRAGQELLEAMDGLAQFLSSHGFGVVSSPQEVTGDCVYLHGRVKAPTRVKQKMELKGYLHPGQVYDLLGIEVISEDLSLGILDRFLQGPANAFKESEGLFSGVRGKKYYHHFNKAGYEAIAIQVVNQQGTPIEIRLVDYDIWERTQDEASPTHHSRHLRRRYGEISGLSEN